MTVRSNDWLATRTSLLCRLRNHEDSVSWEVFCDAYGRVVQSIALKSGLCPADAEDVVQETLVTVARKIGGFHYDRRRGRFKAWLLTIARHRIIDVLRKGARERRLEPAADAASSQTSLLERIPGNAGVDVEALAEEEWRAGLYEAARESIRARISPRQYQVFDLCVTQAWPVEKVVKALGISANQVYVAKHRVGEALREEVRRLERGELAGVAEGRMEAAP